MPGPGGALPCGLWSSAPGLPHPSVTLCGKPRPDRRLSLGLSVGTFLSDPRGCPQVDPGRKRWLKPLSVVDVWELGSGRRWLSAERS